MTNATSSNEQSKSSEFKFLGTYYQITKYYGSNVVRLMELKKDFWGTWKYKTIYFGHLDPLDMTVSFFKNN